MLYSNIISWFLMMMVMMLTLWVRAQTPYTKKHRSSSSSL